MDFETAFDLLIEHEGGFVNDARDTGGATKFGISKAAYPMEDIPAMTLERARFLYRRDYWGPAACDALPPAIRFDVFDLAVNSGPRTAVKMLQRVVGETADGVVGPRTLQAVGSMPPARLVARLSGARLAMLADLPSWPAFGRGWVRRVAVNLMRA